MTGIAVSSFAAGAGAARALLDDPAVTAVQFVRPPLDRTPYAGFVRALLRRPGFKLDLGGQEPDAVLAMVSDRVLGPGAYVAERALLAAEIAALKAYVARLVGGTPPSVSIRTYFAPGDLVWHVDRVNEPAAFRLLWPLGRPAGMRLTSAANIDLPMFRAYMRREHPLLCRMDTRVLRTGVDVETLWAHRPAQLEAMISGRFPFLLDPGAVWCIDPDAISIHRIETPAQPGSYHRSSWQNRRSPGLQVVMTAAAN